MLGGTLSRPLHWAKDCTNHDNGQQGWRERMRCAGQCATSQPTLGGPGTGLRAAPAPGPSVLLKLETDRSHWKTDRAADLSPKPRF
ncbi:uncharacterized protein LOC144340762 isoform X8 [Macaca mulatta]